MNNLQIGFGISAAMDQCIVQQSHRDSDIFSPAEREEINLIKSKLAAQYQGAKLLPPYLGEMGHEVQFFLGVIEPCLRSGWKIIARRPEFYPEGTAIFIPEIFNMIYKITYRHNAVPCQFRLLLNQNFMGRLTIKSQNNALKLVTTVYNNDKHYFTQLQNLQGELSLFLKLIMPDNRQRAGFWQQYLAEISTGNVTYDFLRTAMITTLPPSYQPEEFVNGQAVYQDHIGLQLRQYPMNPQRNSNIQHMMRVAKEASEFLYLPILIYGHPFGTYLPADLDNTANLSRLQGVRLLSYELRALQNCSLMISPNSGWMDLMAWLRVPTLVEVNQENENETTITSIFTRLESFRPKIALLEFHQPTASQIIQLMSRRSQTKLPENYQSITNSPPELVGFANAAYG